MALPSLGFYTTGGVAVTTHDFGNVEAGAYKPDSTGYKTLLYNDYGGTLGSDDATSVKITTRDVDGGTDEIWTQQRWIQAKSNGCSTGSIIDDAQTVFKPVGLNNELALGNIPSGEYRTIYTRCYPPTDAAAQHVDFQLRATYQNPTTPISKWIIRNNLNAVVPTTGDPLAMSVSTGGTIPYTAGYALIDDSEIYYGSSGSYTIIATTGTGTYNVYLDGTGAFGETTGSVGANQLLLYEATYSTGICTALADKRVYLSGLLAGTTGARPLTPNLGDLYLGTTNGQIYAAKSAGSWTQITENAPEQTIVTTTGTANIDWTISHHAYFVRSEVSGGDVTFTFTEPLTSADLRLVVQGSSGGSTGVITWPTAYWNSGMPSSFATGISAIGRVDFYYSTGAGKYLAISLDEFTTG